MTKAGSGDGRWPALRRTAFILAGGAAGGLILTLAHVPAGTLIGAVLGSALVASRGNGDAGGETNHRPMLTRARIAGMIMLGCLSGVALDGHTFQALGRIALPLALSVIALLALDVGLAVFLTRRYGVDPLTALLACAPGGVSELAGTAQDMGARVGVVLAIHLVRVLAVVLVVLPVAILVLGRLG